MRHRLTSGILVSFVANLLAFDFSENSNGGIRRHLRIFRWPPVLVGGRVTKYKPKIIENSKQRGEWAESVFMARASEQGLQVSKPWGDSNSYDFVVGTQGKFVSVQVKSTIYEQETGYECTVRSSGKYSLGSFDFLAAYVIPENSWYIIPAKLAAGKDCIMLYPGNRTAKYEPYREAWHMLREAAAGGGEAHATEDHCEQVSVEEAPADKAGGLPTGALGRMQAAMNFFKSQLERGGVRPEKRDEEG